MDDARQQEREQKENTGAQHSVAALAPFPSSTTPFGGPQRQEIPLDLSQVRISNERSPRSASRRLYNHKESGTWSPTRARTYHLCNSKRNPGDARPADECSGKFHAWIKRGERLQRLSRSENRRFQRSVKNSDTPHGHAMRNGVASLDRSSGNSCFRIGGVVDDRLEPPKAVELAEADAGPTPIFELENDLERFLQH